MHPIHIQSLDSSFPSLLALRELQRYGWARTGETLTLCTDGATDEAGDEAADEAGDGILLCTAHQAAEAGCPDWGGEAEALGAGAALIRTRRVGDARQLVIVGADAAGVLAGAYRVCEHWGVYFHLHGDSMPDAPLKEAPEIHEDRRPLFAVRGLHPFHNFPEGPDGWSPEALRLHIAQMSKMGMNFIGFHSYKQEPQVWLGQPEEVAEDGTVRAGHAVANWHPRGGSWGYSPSDPGKIPLEAGRLVPEDTFDLFADAAESPALFRRIGETWADAFTFAAQRGLETCLGVEIPLHLPEELTERLRANGLDPDSPEAHREVLTGIFTRIARCHPLDWFWLYIPESWIWLNRVPEAEVDAVVAEVALAREALDASGAGFRIGVAGWAIGPRNDPLALEERLPEGIPLAALSPRVGHLPVSPHFCQFRRREGWAVPWMEDDPRLSVPQLWAGRTLRDAADAHAMGCGGLLGIHWRTRGLSPQIAALARSAWCQTDWNPDFGRRLSPEDLGDALAGEGQVGGRAAEGPPFEDPLDTALPRALFETVSLGAVFYRIQVPAGRYRVRCHLAETLSGPASGGRRMSLEVESHVLLDKVDLVELYGFRRVVSVESPEVVMTEDGTIEIYLRQVIGDTLLNAVEVEGHTSGFNQFAGRPFHQRINCGGPELREGDDVWEAGKRISGREQSRPRELDALGFYREWARAEFGPAAGPPAAELFARIDGNLPCITFMKAGPGNCTPDHREWSDVAPEYKFVDEFEALSALPMGGGERDRYAYWLHHFRYFRAAGRLRCAAARPTERTDLEEAWRAVYTELLETVRSPGDLGTLLTVEHQWRLNNLREGAPELDEAYRGTPRLVVPVLPSNLSADGLFILRAQVLGIEPPAFLLLEWKGASDEAWTVREMPRIAEATYELRISVSSLPPLFVYRVREEKSGLQFPLGTPLEGASCIVEPRVEEIEFPAWLIDSSD